MRQEDKLNGYYQIPLRTKLIKLSQFNNPFLPWLSYFILVISYAQLFFVILHSARKCFVDDKSTISSPLNAIVDFVNFDDLFSYNEPSQQLSTSLVLLVAYFICLVFFCLALIYQALYQDESQTLFSRIWALILQIHAPLLFLPIQNLCGRIIFEFNDANFQITSSKSLDTIIFALSIAFFIFNFLFALAPSISLLDILPGKNVLKGINLYVDQLILYQKLIAPLLVHILPNNTASHWVIILVNVLLAFWRHLWFLHTMPRYHLKTLQLNLYLMNIVDTIIVANLFAYILSKIRDLRINFPSLGILFILLIPLAMVWSRIVFRNFVNRVILTPFDKLTYYEAIHKVGSLKFIHKNMRPYNERQNYMDLYYLYFKALDRSKGKLFKEGDKDLNNSNFQEKWVQKQFLRGLLEKLVQRFPKHDTPKLILARFYAKSLKLYPMAIRTLSKIHSKSFSIKNSIELLRLEIQERIIHFSKFNTKELDLYEYITSSHLENGFKKLIYKQLEQQNEFWKEHTKNIPNVFKLSHLSEDIYQQKKLISQKWMNFENKMKNHSHYLYLLNAYYQILLNDSPEKGEEFLKKYKRLSHQYYKPPEENMFFSTSDLYNGSSFSILVRTDQENLGKIISCSKSVQKTLGYERQFLEGTDLSGLMSPYMGERHNSYIQDYLKTGRTIFMDKVRPVLIKDRAGFLKKAHLTAKMFPFVHEEVYLIGVFRLINDDTEHILVTPNGDIDSYSAGIAKKLKIARKKLNINSICKEFEKLTRNITHNGIENLVAEDYEERNEEDSILATEYQPTTTNRLLITNRSESQTKRSDFGTDLKAPDEHTSEEEIKKDENTGIVTIEKQLRENSSKVLSINQQLEFKSITDFPGKYASLPNAPLKLFSFPCKISIVSFKGGYMKFIEIQKTEEKKDTKLMIENEKDDDTEDFYEFPVESIREKGELAHKKDLDFSFDGMDEKEKGWFSQIHLQNNVIPSLEKQDFEHGSVPVPIIQINNFRSRITTTSIVRNSHLGIQASKDYPTVGSKEKHGLMKRVFDKNSSNTSNTNNKKLLHKCIDEALETKYYPKRTFSSLFGFICLLSIVFSMQITFFTETKLSLSRINHFQSIVDYANTRVDALIFIARGIRPGFCYEVGLFDRNSAQISNNVITNLLSSVDQYVPMLQSSNQNLRFALKKLNQNLQTEFGRKNIKMYDINNDTDFTQGSYRYLDSFMATNTLIQKLLYIKNYQNTTGNFPVVDIVFAVNNGINDLLVESISIADKILKDIHQIIDIIIRDVKIYYKVGMSILGLFIIFAFYFIYWTYNSELYRIEQLLKIHQKDVAYIQSMLSRFYNTLESEDYNDFNKISSNVQFIQENRNNFREKSKIARAHKNVNSKEFRRQYWKKTFLLLLIIIIYVCHSSFSFFSTESYIKGLERKINEISKTQELQYEVSITSLTLALIVTYYNNITIRNRSLFEELEADLTYLLDSINIFVETFKKIDNPYDSNVAPFLFEDACKFVSPEVVPQCKTLIIGSESMGLLSLISYEHSLIQSLYQEYQNSDKSFQSAQELSLKTITKLGAAGLTIRDLIFQMIELVKGSYYDLWKHSNKNLIFFMVTNVLVGFICVVGLWMFVFKYLIDSFNRFKRMMKIVPVSVIFRNLTLKGYLIRSSKGKLDSVKHII